MAMPVRDSGDGHRMTLSLSLLQFCLIAAPQEEAEEEMSIEVLEIGGEEYCDQKWLGGERLWYCCAAVGEDKGCDAALGDEHCGLGLESGSEEEETVDNDGELC